MRVVLEIVTVLIFLAWGKWFADDNLRAELYGMSIGIMCALIIELMVALYSKRRLLGLYWDCYKPFIQKEIRITVAYLFRIEENGKYLLVRNHRFQNTFQPVGGVYKYFHPEAKQELDALGIVTDAGIQNDDISEFDLRLKMLKRKELPNFLRWFAKREKRGTDPWREFYEELIEPGILPASDFPFIHPELVAQHFEPIHFDKHFHIDTFKYADVYTPKFINTKQCEHLKRLVGKKHNDYIWVTHDEINKGKSNDGHIIAEHTYKIFETKTLHNAIN